VNLGSLIPPSLLVGVLDLGGVEVGAAGIADSVNETADHEDLDDFSFCFSNSCFNIKFSS